MVGLTPRVAIQNTKHHLSSIFKCPGVDLSGWLLTIAEINCL